MDIGKWIVVAFILFAGFIATLVTVCVRQDISLVSKDYYRDELAYEHQITRIRNVSTLVEKPTIRCKGNQLVVAYRDFNKIKDGKLIVFCPANDKMDRTFTLQASRLIQTFDVSDLQRGMYRVRIHWSIAGQQFFLEEIINL